MRWRTGPLADNHPGRNRREERYSANTVRLPVAKEANASVILSGGGSEFKNMTASGGGALTRMPASASWNADCGVRDVGQHSVRYEGEVVGADLVGQKSGITPIGEVYA